MRARTARAPLGWARVDPRPWRKTTARWWHTSGWHIVHCGHPTANHPWALYDPQGYMHTTGGQLSGGRKPWNGTAWNNLVEVWDYVAFMLENPKRFRWPVWTQGRHRLGGKGVR